MNEFAINHYILPAGEKLAPFLDTVAAAGAGGVGVTQRALDEVPAPRLDRMLRERGLRATSVNSAGFVLHADPARAAAQRRENRRLIEAAAELRAEALVVIPGGLQDAPPGTSLAAARAMIEPALAELREDCARAGVRPALEPMHPVSLVWKGCVNTLAQAEALCDRIGGMDLVLDVFHSWWDPDLDAVIARSSSRIALVQLCNVLQPHGAAALPRRAALSEGVVDLADLLRSLRDAGYAGSFEFEMFAEQMHPRPGAAEIARAVDDFGALARAAA